MNHWIAFNIHVDTARAVWNPVFRPVFTLVGRNLDRAVVVVAPPFPAGRSLAVEYRNQPITVIQDYARLATNVPGLSNNTRIELHV